MTMHENAYAKINLYLAVGEKRADGFHDILTYMRAVSLADELKIDVKKASDTKITLKVEGNAAIPADKTNLVYKAALLFLDKARQNAHVNIHLKKVIPTGAGLGGGSSDGAAVLRALNRFYDFPFSEKELSELAAALGSDVPFFITSKAALCEGRGEKLKPLRTNDNYYALIVGGKEHSNTAVAYRLLDEWKQRNGSTPKKDVDVENFSIHDVYNDFEAPISLACPSVKEHLDMLASFEPLACAMSGSGSAVFGIFETEEKA
ncbi:MAG: 4-(cytidine 5'-diphospho)-2-C-methyl-D-erythritol kinase, partial [Clostridia bacterium]|nr:4-(cytidine 5'-diphospho)-2-C-methyl-D-erythritol kinase [Clostridia bacterium]